MKSFVEAKIEGWAHEGGLFPLCLIDNQAEGERLWFFYSENELISSRDGLCDEAVIGFFASQHHLSPEDRAAFDQELYG